jgi:hypothetical protein
VTVPPIEKVAGGGGGEPESPPPPPHPTMSRARTVIDPIERNMMILRNPAIRDSEWFRSFMTLLAF